MEMGKGANETKEIQTSWTGKDSVVKKVGYLDAYTYNERKLLICPSGYTFGQGMNALHKLWFAYRNSKSESNIAKMERYAKAIEDSSAN